jgi:hypothetical protein
MNVNPKGKETWDDYGWDEESYRDSFILSNQHWQPNAERRDT